MHSDEETTDTRAAQPSEKTGKSPASAPPANASETATQDHKLPEKQELAARTFIEGRIELYLGRARAFAYFAVIAIGVAAYANTTLAEKSAEIAVAKALDRHASTVQARMDREIGRYQNAMESLWTDIGELRVAIERSRSAAETSISTHKSSSDILREKYLELDTRASEVADHLSEARESIDQALSGDIDQFALAIVARTNLPEVVTSLLSTSSLGIQTNSLTVVDSEGRQRISLSCPDDTPVISITNQDDQPAISLSVDNSDTSLNIRNFDNNTSLNIHCGAESEVLTFAPRHTGGIRSSNRGSAVFCSNAEGGLVSLFTDDTSQRLQTSGTGILAEDKTGPWLHAFRGKSAIPQFLLWASPSAPPVFRAPTE